MHTFLSMSRDTAVFSHEQREKQRSGADEQALVPVAGQRIPPKEILFLIL